MMSTCYLFSMQTIYTAVSDLLYGRIDFICIICDLINAAKTVSIISDSCIARHVSLNSNVPKPY